MEQVHGIVDGESSGSELSVFSDMNIIDDFVDAELQMRPDNRTQPAWISPKKILSTIVESFDDDNNLEGTAFSNEQKSQELTSRCRPHIKRPLSRTASSDMDYVSAIPSPPISPSSTKGSFGSETDGSFDSAPDEPAATRFYRCPTDGDIDRLGGSLGYHLRKRSDPGTLTSFDEGADALSEDRIAEQEASTPSNL
eukprot:CAMPEP_0113298796 /NCGR_PEP_ID=MMETSP0010_2-20120614/1093_1 /TAXON_ID=216773 ORGANISM="Corethron hystrix, Strain 308" /NCGR_SAMPLE_ID=MMETSP0010_2 /ASSEMBLY_ACC=CAM_ASM_000155 /LENGTH=195 /DNA_ID=CAMNT_0000151913 /DNA_START=62 /DNA_END=650 /DNA_ORIENTATION=+ /assembly_acc=CAM_ASM_000155